MSNASRARRRRELLERRTVDCRGCGCPVGVLEAVCTPCLDLLPAGVRAEYDAAHAAYDVPARLDAQDAAGICVRRIRGALPPAPGPVELLGPAGPGPAVAVLETAAPTTRRRRDRRSTRA